MYLSFLGKQVHTFYPPQVIYLDLDHTLLQHIHLGFT